MHRGRIKGLVPPPLFQLIYNNTDKMPSLNKSTSRPWIPKPKERKLTKTWQPDGENIYYHSKKWKALRMQVLREEPMCRECKANGVVTEATVVDHILPARLGGGFWDRDNLQSLCRKCHASKSGKEAHQPKKYTNELC